MIKGSIAIFQDMLPFFTWSILVSGILGASFQVAIIKDYLNVLAIHMTCFYVYAARIYKMEFDSLRSLFRLFGGRKLNPLRKRIDSYVYGADQLFIGTLGFSIVFFLLPTVLMYYAVFLSVNFILCISLVRLIIIFIQLKGSSRSFPHESRFKHFRQHTQQHSDLRSTRLYIQYSTRMHQG